MQEAVAQWFVTGLGMAVWGVPIIFVVYFLVRNFLASYTNEKAKNMATKEDIAVITSEVKAVEDVFNRGLADLNAHHQVRMIAAERRIQAHQEAYFHAMQMVRYANAEGDHLMNVVVEAQSWYDKNCLFLGEKTRRSFHTASLFVMHHRDYVQNRVDADIVKQSWAKIMEPLEHVAKEVELPPFSAQELKEATTRRPE